MPELRVPGPRGVALQAAGLERDNRRFRANAAGLEHGALQAGGLSSTSVVVAPPAGGLKRHTTRLKDTVPGRLHRR